MLISRWGFVLWTYTLMANFKSMSRDPSEYVFKHMWEEETGKEYRNIRQKQKIATCHVHLHHLCIGNRFFSHHQAGYLSLPSPSFHLCLSVPRQQREKGGRNAVQEKLNQTVSDSGRKGAVKRLKSWLYQSFLKCLSYSFKWLKLSVSIFWFSKLTPGCFPSKS